MQLAFVLSVLASFISKRRFRDVGFDCFKDVTTELLIGFLSRNNETTANETPNLLHYGKTKKTLIDGQLNY